MQPAAKSNKLGFEESLGIDVIRSGKCLECGACVVVCPFKCLEYSEGKPTLTKECKNCGICARICPQYNWSQNELEKTMFGRERDISEEFGIYRRLAIGQATDDKILKISQDGGVVTALLSFALEKGLIDGAIVSGVNKEKPFFPTPRLATSLEEILASSGTRYFYSPNLLALNEAIEQKKTSIGFVGTPCQIRAIRKMQAAKLKCASAVKLLIGLMCSECFVYKGLVEKHVHETLGIDPNDIMKMNIKGKMILTTNKGIQAIPLGEIKKYARGNCGFCRDFSSEFADISTGGLGLDGWTFAINRTEKGEELFSSAEKAGVIKTRDASGEANALNLLSKLSRKKRHPLIT
jgi:coenzyme F420 hydrogenase subunit beta